MENIVRIKHLTGLDKLGTVWEPNIPMFKRDVERIHKKLDCYIEEIKSSNEDGVHLGFFLEDRIRFTMAIFPLYDKVEYVFKEGDFLLNRGSDPRIIRMNSQRELEKGVYIKEETFFTNQEYLLFTQNPLENREKYKHMKKILP